MSLCNRRHLWFVVAVAISQGCVAQQTSQESAQFIGEAYSLRCLLEGPENTPGRSALLYLSEVGQQERGADGDLVGTLRLVLAGEKNGEMNLAGFGTRDEFGHLATIHGDTPAGAINLFRKNIYVGELAEQFGDREAVSFFSICSVEGQNDAFWCQFYSTDPGVTPPTPERISVISIEERDGVVTGQYDHGARRYRLNVRQAFVGTVASGARDPGMVWCRDGANSRGIDCAPVLFDSHDFPRWERPFSVAVDETTDVDHLQGSLPNGLLRVDRGRPLFRGELPAQAANQKGTCVY